MTDYIGVCWSSGETVEGDLAEVTLKTAAPVLDQITSVPQTTHIFFAVLAIINNQLSIECSKPKPFHSKLFRSKATKPAPYTLIRTEVMWNMASRHFIDGPTSIVLAQEEEVVWGHLSQGDVDYLKGSANICLRSDLVDAISNGPMMNMDDPQHRLSTMLEFVLALTLLHEACRVLARATFRTCLAPTCVDKDEELRSQLETRLLGGEIEIVWNHGVGWNIVGVDIKVNETRYNLPISFMENFLKSLHTTTPIRPFVAYPNAEPPAHHQYRRCRIVGLSLQPLKPINSKRVFVQKLKKNDEPSYHFDRVKPYKRR
ncbi:hypothetical protein EUX98_g7056 [Antrodiella citrinella]|uniref:Uncharacterized protein n=1 Tax=Antrodiella citrinella TaxID=2447956 RepID=A0A4S4MMI4_9APHY|nr:hypothetical protein EUX98_g7056 [Antrodiella citrinella]